MPPWIWSRLARHALGHLGREELGHRRLLLDRFAGVAVVRDLVHERARGLDLRRHVGELEADRLELGDRLPELHALLGVGERVLERAAGEADRAGGGVDAGDVQAVHRRVEGAALRRGVVPSYIARAEDVSAGTRRPSNHEVVGRDAVVADLVDRRCR